MKKIHGDGKILALEFEFHRNSIMNSNDWINFHKKKGKEKTQRKKNTRYLTWHFNDALF